MHRAPRPWTFVVKTQLSLPRTTAPGAKLPSDSISRAHRWAHQVRLSTATPRSPVFHSEYFLLAYPHGYRTFSMCHGTRCLKPDRFGHSPFPRLPRYSSEVWVRNTSTPIRYQSIKENAPITYRQHEDHTQMSKSRLIQPWVLSVRS